MYFEELESFLKKELPEETWHKQNPDALSRRYQMMPYEYINGEKVYLFDFTSEMVDDICIIKERRYTPLYKHYHQYMEINYVYSGECRFTINETDVVLKEGDFCLLEPNVIHSALPKKEQDIVINMAMREKYYDSQFIGYMDENQIIYDFLLSSFRHDRKHNKYLIFRKCDNPMLEMIFHSIFYLYFSEKQKNYLLLEEYIRMMFFQMANTAYDNLHSDYQKQEDKLVLEVLNIIQTSYADCDLRTIAEHSGYNYNYVSNLIKKWTGKTFRELKLNQQMIAAKDLLKRTDLPVYEIAAQCGFSNLNFFYKKFSESEQCMPKEFRENNKSNTL